MHPQYRLPLVLLIAGLSAGCERETPPQIVAPTASPRTAPATEPPAVPDASALSPPGGKTPEPPPATPGPDAVTDGGSDAKAPQPTETKLDGITLQIPQGWIPETVPVNMSMPGMAPKAVFRLPAAQTAGEDLHVRVTHFPRMKVSDEMNLRRWYGMLVQPDGRSTEEVATVERFEIGTVQIVLADIPGTVEAIGPRAGMDGPVRPAKPGRRMLAAIIKHDHGPHFVKMLGRAEDVERWRESFVACLKSVKTD